MRIRNYARNFVRSRSADRFRYAYDACRIRALLCGREETLLGNGICHCTDPMTLLNRRVPRRRVITDIAIGVVSIAAALACVMAIDGRVPRVLWRLAHGGVEGASLPGNTAMLARSGWDLASMHMPMAVFATVAIVLVVCMVRMK
jgi:hypothetical protein